MINNIPVLATSSNDLSNLLCKSIEYERSKKEADQLAAENAFLHNQVTTALDLFEARFLSDPSQFAPGEFEWYKDAAREMYIRYGRPEITAKVAEYVFNSILGTV